MTKEHQEWVPQPCMMFPPNLIAPNSVGTSRLIPCITCELHMHAQNLIMGTRLLIELIVEWQVKFLNFVKYNNLIT